MKKFLFLAALAAASVFAACHEKEEQTNSPSDGKEITLRATISEGAKALLDETSLQMLWQEGDQIDVMNMGSHNCGAYTLESGNGTTNATFVGSDFTESKEYYALYPYRTGMSKSSGYYRFAIPQDQTYAENSVGRGANIMVATFTSQSELLQFKNVLGLLKLSLSGTAKVYKITVTDNNGTNNLWGSAALYVNDGTQGSDGQVLTITGGDNSVNLLCPDGVQLSSVAKPFYIAVPPGSFATGMTVRIYEADDYLLDEFSTVRDIAIVRSNIRPMKSKNVLRDLSKDGTSNCYVVYTNGEYKFKTVKGNGNESVGSPVTADVLWESSGTTTAPTVGDIVSSPSYADGYVSFSVTGTAGNAVIAVRDSENNILWSWHIWVPSTTIETATYTGKTAEVMDRNLGALVAAENNILSNGLTYQWGRKDPFPGSASYSSNTVAATTGSFTSSVTTAEKGTEAYVILHPTDYLKQDKAIQTNSDWVVGGDGNNTHWGSSKTIWDPCPVGYKVPSHTIWSDLSFEVGTYSMTLDSKHWYPVTGYRFSSDGSIHETGAKGFYWTSVAGQYQANYGKFEYTPSGTSTFGSSSMARSAGLAVRCVKE